MVANWRVAVDPRLRLLLPLVLRLVRDLVWRHRRGRISVLGPTGTTTGISTLAPHARWTALTRATQR